MYYILMYVCLEMLYNLNLHFVCVSQMCCAYRRNVMLLMALIENV